MRLTAFILLCWLYVLTVPPANAQETTPQAEITPEVTSDAPDINAALVGLVDAQFIAAQPDPLIGERVQVQLRIETPSNVTIVQWPEFPPDAEPFQVLNASERIRQATDDGWLHTQTLELVIWQPGQHLTPEIPVVFSVAGSSGISAPVRSATFNIPSVLQTATDVTLRPWLPPRDLPYISPWWIVGAVLLALIILSLLILLLRGGLRRASQLAPGSPARLAVAELEDLRAQGLQPQTLYPLVANRIRSYVQLRFAVNATELTTDELTTRLREADHLNADLRTQLRQLLNQADLVKFARFEPDEHSSEQLINFAIGWLRAAERTERSHEANHA